MSAVAAISSDLGHPASERPPRYIALGDTAGRVHIFSTRGHLLVVHETGVCVRARVCVCARVHVRMCSGGGAHCSAAFWQVNAAPSGRRCEPPIRLHMMVAMVVGGNQWRWQW